MRIPERTHRAFALPRGRRDFLRQLTIWFGFAAAYQIARGLAGLGAGQAFANARRVIRMEERLSAFFEPDLQRSIVKTGGLLLHAVNWTYWLSQFAVVGLALLWIYLRRNPAYLRVRNTIIVANTIGLVGYIALPTAPPRLFPELGFTDTLARAEALNHGTSLIEFASNPYAAMPSLHAADALIIGLALATLVRSPVPKILFALWPAWVYFSLIASGNHFWLDIAAGAVLAAVGAWVARRLERRPPTFLHRRRPVPAHPGAS
ncbi:MAG: phosphatase PAP2 family protein [Gaiellaceae bacterium]